MAKSKPRIGDFRWRVPASETGCEMHVQETILQRLGKALHAHWDHIEHEPLPRRWVELIHHLNEQERARERVQQTQLKGRERPH